MKDSDNVQKVKIFNSVNRQNVYISIIRYFQYENEDYLVYYDNEESLENQRIFIYVAKLRDTVSATISDSEWKNIYQYLKMIGYAAKENKIIAINDLSIEKLNGVVISNFRKLSVSYDNLKYFINPEFMQNNNPYGIKEVKRVPIKSHVSKDINYQNLYTKELEENQKLKKRIADLENLTLSYQLNLQQINELLKANEK